MNQKPPTLKYPLISLLTRLFNSTMHLIDTTTNTRYNRRSLHVDRNCLNFGDPGRSLKNEEFVC